MKKGLLAVVAIAVIGCSGVAPQKAISGEPTSPALGYDIHLQAPHVMADGMLDVSDQLIHHPVLLQRVNLEFNPSGPEFCFNTGTEKVELHRALLRLVPSIEGRMIGSFDQELEADPVEPLGGVSTSGFLRRLVQGLFTDGEFLERHERRQALSRPIIWREPVIFLRPRSAGLNTTLDYICRGSGQGYGVTGRTGSYRGCGDR